MYSYILRYIHAFGRGDSIAVLYAHFFSVTADELISQSAEFAEEKGGSEVCFIYLFYPSPRR